MTGRVEKEVSAALARIGVAPNERIMLALSGGPDSMALLHALYRTGRRPAAAHLNHRLRGAESDRDEAFVRRVCTELGIELIVEQVELGAGLANLEERAREARYAFLERAAEGLNARYIALGHQADDQAETIAMRMLRGAGLAGLCAMSEAGPGRIIRPLLTLHRRDLLDYLATIGVECVADSSNRSPLFLRNRVRHELIPAIERDYVPGFSRRLIELGREVREAGDFIAMAAERELDARLGSFDTLEIAGFGGLHPALVAAMLRAFIARRIGTLRGIDRSHVRALMRLCAAGPPNGRLNLPGGWSAIRTYGTLAIEQSIGRPREPYAIELVRNGQSKIAPARCSVGATIISADAAPMPIDSREALFDADRISGPLVARSLRPGDRIEPLGMSGSRKVKDVFIDRKLPRAERACYPLVALGDRILWIPAMVRSRHALIGAETQKVLRLKASFLGAERQT